MVASSSGCARELWQHEQYFLLACLLPNHISLPPGHLFDVQRENDINAPIEV